MNNTKGTTMIAEYATVQANASTSTEVSLVSAARQGDRDAFNTLVKSYQDHVFNLAVRILGDEDAAADITQHTFLTAYTNLTRFRNGSFRGWLFRIATNACYDEYRHHKRHPNQSIEEKDLADEKLISPFNELSSHSSPETEFEKRELESMIQSAINQIDLDQRTVLILVDQQELSYQEAAQVLRIPIGTIKSRLARARLRARQLLSGVLDRG